MLNKIFLGLVVLFGLISAASLLHTGLPPTHDGEYHVVRFYEFYKTLSNGDLYPRWAPDLNFGYGVPLFNYVYPLPNYISAITHLVGFSFIDSFKLNLLLATLIGAIFMYLWVKDCFGEISGLVASVFYLFSPYRFVDVYVRGSVGEVWAMALFPALMWATEKARVKGDNVYLVVSGVIFSLIIISHNILALLFSLFYVIYSIVDFKKKRSLMKSIIIVVLGTGIAAIFWLPALLEKNLVVGLTTYNVKENFVELYQLIIPSWGTGFSGGDLNNQMSYQVGLANLSVVFLSLIFIFKNFKKKIPKIKFIVLSLVSVFVLVFLMTAYSSFVWDIIPLFNYFQFPWRLLSLVIILCAFLSGSVLAFIKNKTVKVIFAAALILFALVTTISYIKIPYYLERGDAYYMTRSNFIDGTNSIGNAFNTKWFNSLSSKAKNKLELSSEGAVRVLEEKPTFYKFELESTHDEKAVLNVAYFPGWTVYVDNKRQNTLITSKGLISFNLKKGKQSVLIKLENTPIEKTAILITLTSIFLAGAVFSTNRAGIIKNKS